MNKLDSVIIKHPSNALSLLGKWMKRKEENFLTITLDGNHSIIKVHHITKGLMNKTVAHPRECFYPAIKDYASSVVFVHNHPSGQLKASPEDNELTDRLCKAGYILGIYVLDHLIIIPNGDYYSFRQNDKMQDSYCSYELDDFTKTLNEEEGIILRTVNKKTIKAYS